MYCTVREDEEREDEWNETLVKKKNKRITMKIKN